jgi:DEAD/DEAH box helicase domain-containing protein
MTVYGGVGSDDMQQKKFKAETIVYAVLDDREESRTEKYEQEWNGFWQFYNVLQFLKSFAGVSENGMKEVIYNKVPLIVPVAAEVANAENVAAWPTEILVQLLDEQAKLFAEKCAELAIVAPDTIGYELEDNSGTVVGEAEMAWEGLKIAFLLEEQTESKDAFITAGWKVITADEEIQTDWFKEVE